ncbi:MAG TPA: hypothetical protein VF331_27700 [Polyangiales bacterium]
MRRVLQPRASSLPGHLRRRLSPWLRCACAAALAAGLWSAHAVCTAPTRLPAQLGQLWAVGSASAARGKKAHAKASEPPPANRAKLETGADTPAPKPKIPLGVNLGAVDYYGTAVPFTDLMRMAGEFQSTNAQWVEGGKNEWNTGVADQIPHDELGYPLQLPYMVPGQDVAQVVRAPLGQPIYAGTYTLLYDGDGEIDFPASPVRVQAQGPGRMVLEVERTAEAAIWLRILRSSRDNHVRNVRLLLPGFEYHYATQVFHPAFLLGLGQLGVVRFMDWGRTNDSALAHWEQRPKPNLPQGGPLGVSIEVMIDLANQAGADPWFCVPHAADDHYVEEMAKLVKTRLSPGRKAYIEYSNELWNPMFSQYAYTVEQGCKAGLNKLPPSNGKCGQGDVDLWTGGKWVARRSAQIFEIFERVFGGHDRLVRVLAGQAAWWERNEALLSAFRDRKINPHAVQADALAIAPYFGGGLPDEIVQAGEVASISVGEILRRASVSLVEQTAKNTSYNKDLADRYGLRLCAYEGGQHLVATGPAANDAVLTQKLMAANRDPRMGFLYEQMLDTWYRASGGGTMVLFNYISPFGKFGSWGLREEQEQPIEASPKYQAYLARLRHFAAPK